MPDMSRRLDTSLWKNHLFAHRGFHQNRGLAPENSLEAFRLAVENGYGIELDVQLTKDNIPVVFHDYSLKRVCQVDEMVKDLTFEELQKLTLYYSKERIPSLESALKLIDGKVPLIVEFKAEGKDTSVCDFSVPLLKKYKGLYCIESFNPFILMWHRKNNPHVIRGQLSSHLTLDSKNHSKFLYFLLQNLLFNFLTKPDFIAYNHKHTYMTSYILCRMIFRVTTFAWTIQSQKDLEASAKDFDYYIFDSFTPISFH